MASLLHLPRDSMKRASDTHLLGCYLGLSASLVVLKKRKLSCRCKELVTVLTELQIKVVVGRIMKFCVCVWGGGGGVFFLN
jgi:hypothetical protein